VSNLTNEQISSYNENGFLIIKNLISEKNIEELKQLFEEFNQKNLNNWENKKEMAYYETSTFDNKKRILMRVENLIDFHPLIKNLVYSEKLFPLIEKLMGEKVVLFKDKINFKNPNSGGFRAHQDPNKSWLKISKNFCNALITISESKIENGCLEVAPKYHKLGLIPKDGSGLLTEENTKNMEFQKIPTSPGDVIFFDALTPHRSKSNTTNSQRINVYLTYNTLADGDHRHEYFDEKRTEFPPDNERNDTTNFKNSSVHEALYAKN
jgi:2-aminoethylphosphonate dioxygenase|tara:strand:+ start:958 stop:1755 length:798 start_codon:yes stop_codon:yes gene_type:complete